MRTIDNGQSGQMVRLDGRSFCRSSRGVLVHRALYPWCCHAFLMQTQSPRLPTFLCNCKLCEGNLVGLPRIAACGVPQASWSQASLPKLARELIKSSNAEALQKLILPTAYERMKSLYPIKWINSLS